jgi:hypothetical protein
VKKITEQFEERGATYEVTVETKNDEHYPSWHCTWCDESGSASPSRDFEQAIANAQTNFRYHAAEHARAGQFS